MIRLTDGKQTVVITMAVWQGDCYAPSCAAEYFEVCGLPYDKALDAYRVEDVTCYTDRAKKWETESDNNTVLIEQVGRNNAYEEVFY